MIAFAVAGALNSLQNVSCSLCSAAKRDWTEKHYSHCSNKTNKSCTSN